MTARAGAGRPLGLGHQTHPLIGKLVIDTAHEDTPGILRAVAPDVAREESASFSLCPKPARSAIERAEPVAWLAPERGGVEWPTPLDSIRPA